jgi:hypothetical protein
MEDTSRIPVFFFFPPHKKEIFYLFSGTSWRGKATRGLRLTNDVSRFSVILTAIPAGMPIAIISDGRFRFWVGSCGP